MKENQPNALQELLDRFEEEKANQRFLKPWAEADSIAPPPEKAIKDFSKTQIDRIIRIAQNLKDG